VETYSNVPFSLRLPYFAKAEEIGGQRFVYFETSREGVIDREGDDILADALWASKDLFLEQGTLDINHWSFLGNPYGTERRPEYEIGIPVDARRQGKSIFVKGQIYTNATKPTKLAGFEGMGFWADEFWHSITAMNPPKRWYPSVFGNIKSVRVENRRGRRVRVITGTEWYSVGFATRAQHPELPPVSTEPMGGLRKAVDLNLNRVSKGVWEMGVNTFVKALTTGDVVLDSPSKTGVQALTRESLEGAVRNQTERPAMPYEKMRARVFNRIRKGQMLPKYDTIRAFLVAQGMSKKQATEITERIMRDVLRVLG